MTQTNYCFYIVCKDDTEVQWTGITERQAIALERITSLHKPDKVKKFGWGRIPLAIWEKHIKSQKQKEKEDDRETGHKRSFGSDSRHY